MSLGDQASDPSALELVLAGYAAGSLPPSLHALVGAHLELSSVNRPFVDALEEALGRSVAGHEPAAIRARAARLDSIFALGAVSAKPAAGTTGEPRALRHFFGKPIDQLGFHTVLPGIRECRIETGDDTRAVLYRIRAGSRMPQHSHEGSEVTLVLRGGFRDETGHFRRGDMVIADEHLDHVPLADPDEECVCFAVLDAPLRLTGTFGRLFNRFIRH